MLFRTISAQHTLSYFSMPSQTFLLLHGVPKLATPPSFNHT